MVAFVLENVYSILFLLNYRNPGQFRPQGRTIGHVIHVYYCIQWSELTRASRRTEEARSRFLHVYSISKLVLRALHGIRCLVTRIVWLNKVRQSQKDEESFSGGSLAPLCFVGHLDNVFQPLVFSS